ncbi:Na+/H+ antiporter subunit D [Oryzicola mucosus]|uniref:Na+/H+ antiporter subunit D n=1 Tax=Oryzicola mucosus TaxID=2767425 RepID=A0A8J6U5B9_9HYPH|nr:Na+/H+ antiporter subunit D [Oryzicola mucosus]MBD0415930.1 Na+/H+ antiporter subunit D [Oryzicola mucosus]
MAGESYQVDRAQAMIAGPVASADWLIVVPVVLPIVCGALLLMFRHRMRIHAFMALAALALVTAANASMLRRVLADGPFSMTMGGWLPPFGISFTADVLGVSFALVGSAVAFICCLYSLGDIDRTGRRYGFYAFLMLMMAGVNGAFLTGDMFNLYVWFEVFLISSFGLLILGSDKAQIDGAVKYAILNLVATTLFLIATGYVYGTFGTLNMADLARKVDGLSDTAPLMTLSALYLLAFCMKAAAFPVNFWLPASYHTPRIVTAALFGGLLTKIGIYALMRSMILIFAVERAAYSMPIAIVAGATMILGALGALAQSDLRRMAGFLVISGVGVMLSGLALGSEGGLAGMAFYALNSMVVMTALYILAGTMGAAGAGFSLHDLGGLYRARPLLAAIAFLLILAAAALPPASGLWPKIVLVQASLAEGAGWLAGAILVSGFLTTLALGRVFLLAFWRPASASLPIARVPSLSLAVLLLLLVPVLLVGLYPEPVIAMSGSAAKGLLDPSAYIQAVFPQAGGG